MADILIYGNVFINEYYTQHSEAHASANITKSDLAEVCSQIKELKPFGFYSFEASSVGPVALTERTPEARELYRKGRNYLSPVIIYEGECPNKTNEITIGVCLENGKYYIFTAFRGPLAPKEPGDPRCSDAERPEAEAFWAKHALLCRADELA